MIPRAISARFDEAVLSRLMRQRDTRVSIIDDPRSPTIERSGFFLSSGQLFALLSRARANCHYTLSCQLYLACHRVISLTHCTLRNTEESKRASVEGSLATMYIAHRKEQRHACCQIFEFSVDSVSRPR